MKLIDRLERFADLLPRVAVVATPEDARWKPASGAWSILEIVMHLVDEEVEDFRARVKLTLEAPGTLWPAIDPEAAARDRKYNEADLHTAIERFVTERRASVAWLRSLKNDDWSTAYIHPRRGPVQVGELIASWPAHDALHLRQIAKRLYELAGRDGSPHATEYAGTWGA